MKKLFVLSLFLLAIKTMAQEEKLRITFNMGNPIELNVSDVESIAFVEDQTPLDIVGEWFCEEENLGTFESFYFHEDGSLGYYYYYINYHNGGTLFGTYSFEDYMIKVDLQYVGIQTLPVVGHSKTEFTVRYSNDNSIYYKVQKVYYMTTKDSPISIGNEGDVVTYVDKEVVGLEDNKIKALKKGSGYALVNDVKLNTIVAYKIIVGDVPLELTDWTQYFNKTRSEIELQFGTPDKIYLDENTGDIYTYEEYNAEISLLHFTFDRNSDKVYQVGANFHTSSYFDAYHDDIKKRYVYNEDQSTTTEYVYYDTEDPSIASVKVIVLNLPPYTMFINFTSLK